jgi:transposase
VASRDRWKAFLVSSSIFHRVLATVELKMDDSACRSYQLDELKLAVDEDLFEKNPKAADCCFKTSCTLLST